MLHNKDFFGVMPTQRNQSNRGRVRTASRSGATAGVSLAKRRRWFADDDESDGDDSGGSDKYNPADLDEARKIIDALTKRVDEREQTISDLKNQQGSLAERLAAMEQAQQERLEQEGDFKKLAQQRQAELEKLKPYLTRAEKLEEIIRAGNEARIQQIPETMRGLVPADYAPEKLQQWLDNNAAALSRQPAPDYEGGVRGTGGDGQKKLSADEREAMKLMGLSEDDMLRAKFGNDDNSS